MCVVVFVLVVVELGPTTLAMTTAKNTKTQSSQNTPAQRLDMAVSHAMGNGGAKRGHVCKNDANNRIEVKLGKFCTISSSCCLPAASLEFTLNLTIYFFVSTRANGARWWKIDGSFVGGCLAKGKFFLSRSSTPEECYRFLVRLQIGFGFALPRRRARGLRVRCFI